MAKWRLKRHLLCQCLRLPGPGQSPSQLLMMKSGVWGGGQDGDRSFGPGNSGHLAWDSLVFPAQG